MTVDFPYPGYEAIAPAQIPDANMMGVYAPRRIPVADEETIMAQGIAEPIGASRLRDVVRREDRVLLLVDDATRGTPVPRVLRHVGKLEAAGIRDNRIEVLTAQGTHRRVTDAELRRKLGSFHDRFVVHQHDWLDEAALHDFGCTTDGTRVTANRLLAASDFTLGVGSIVPHRIMGFSGGAKIVFPGIAGREIQERCQREAAGRRSEDVMGLADNPMRRRIEEAARLVGLRYIVNCVVDGEGRMAGCFAGDVVLTHRAGSRLSETINSVTLPRRADIVLTGSHPADRDFWQSAKGIYSGTMAVRDGGTLILVAPNPEGVAEEPSSHAQRRLSPDCSAHATGGRRCDRGRRRNGSAREYRAGHGSRRLPPRLTRRRAPGRGAPRLSSCAFTAGGGGESVRAPGNEGNARRPATRGPHPAARGG